MKIKDTHSYSMAGNELDVGRGHPFGLIKDWFTCWQPDKEELKRLMRKVFKNRGSKFITDQAIKIRDTLSFDNIIKEMKVAFEVE